MNRPIAIHVLVALALSACLAGCDRGSASNAAVQRPPAPTSAPTIAAADSARPAGVLTLPDRTRQPSIHPDEVGLPALRIVCAAPNVSEICCALGLRECIVARTRYCTHPPELASVADIGALVDVNAERLFQLHPDLIIVSGASRALTERLAPLGLRLESVPDSDLADLFAAIARIGRLCGRPRSAELLNADIRAQLDRVDTEFRGVSSARVLLLTGTLPDPPQPPFVAGRRSFYDELLRRAGHLNVAPEDAPAFGALSLEVILKLDPDVIVELDPDGHARPAGDADALRVWAEVGPLTAVRTRRVHVLTGPQHYLLGPRLAQTYSELCRALAGPDGKRP